MKKDDRRTLIVIIVVCLVCGGIIYFFGRKSNFDKLVLVDSYKDFFIVENEIQKYIEYIAIKDESKLLSILDSKYKNDNLVDINAYNYTSFTTFSSAGIYYVTIGQNSLFYVSGKIIDNDYEGAHVLNDNFKIVVLNDTSSNSFSIYPVNDDNYMSIINGIKRISISNNSVNSISGNFEITDSQICKLYFFDYISKIADNDKSAYDLLGSNMKKDFSNYDNFSEFIDKNISKFSFSSKLCSKEEYKDGKRLYTVIDKNNNVYYFTENGVMNYSVDFYFNSAEETEEIETNDTEE